MTEIIKSDNSLVPAQMAEKIIKLETLKKEVAAQLDDLKAQLLEFTRNNDVYTLKTGSYTISRCKRETVNIYDVHDILDWSHEHGLVQIQTTVALTKESEDLVKKMVKNGTEVPSTSLQTTEYLTVKIAKSKE